MKYTFDVITLNNGEHSIKIDIVQNTGFPSNISKTITFTNEDDTYVPNLNDILDEMIDNMRLTVKERRDAIDDAKIFIHYLQNHLIEIIEDEKMITENENPSIIIK